MGSGMAGQGAHVVGETNTPAAKPPPHPQMVQVVATENRSHKAGILLDIERGQIFDVLKWKCAEGGKSKQKLHKVRTRTEPKVTGYVLENDVTVHEDWMGDDFESSAFDDL